MTFRGYNLGDALRKAKVFNKRWRICKVRRVKGVWHVEISE